MVKIVAVFTVCISFVSLVRGIEFVKDQNSAKEFLQYYGYLSEDESTSESLIDYESAYYYGDYYNDNPQKIGKATDGGIPDAIKEFQEYSSLKVTGILDDDTVELMNTPRCGVPDKFNATIQEYLLQGSLWKKRILSYSLLNYPSSQYLTPKQTKDEIKMAFKQWQSVANLKFIESTCGVADIEISFERVKHKGCNFIFKNNRRDLAHAFFPQYGGNIHFNDVINWSPLGSFQKAQVYIGPSLFKAALHELGHSLGLEHSRDPNAVMYPYLRRNTPNSLQQDDIDGIQAIYGIEVEYLKDADYSDYEVLSNYKAIYGIDEVEYLKDADYSDYEVLSNYKEPVEDATVTEEALQNLKCLITEHQEHIKKLNRVEELVELLSCNSETPPPPKYCKCSDPYANVNGLCLYIKYPYPQTWKMARRYCKTMSGYLAEYNTEEEFKTIRTFIVDHLVPNGKRNPDYENGVWIGGTDENEHGKYIWSQSGKPVPDGYGWGIGQPDFDWEHYLNLYGIQDFTTNDVNDKFMSSGTLCQMPCN